MNGFEQNELAELILVALNRRADQHDALIRQPLDFERYARADEAYRQCLDNLWNALYSLEIEDALSLDHGPVKVPPRAYQTPKR
jgi:hypothetical protein